MGHNMGILDIHFGCNLGYRVHMAAHRLDIECFELGILEFGWHNLVGLVQIFYILSRQNF